MKTPYLLFALACASLVLSGCSTPQSRIEANPQLYNALSNSNKNLVAAGRITEGMSKEAVFLAWGKPDYTKSSSSGRSVTETWIYTGTEPVYAGSLGYGYGFHHYGHGRHGYYPSYCYGPTVYYRPYVAGKVTFRRNRVTQWEVTHG